MNRSLHESVDFFIFKKTQDSVLCFFENKKVCPTKLGLDFILNMGRTRDLQSRDYMTANLIAVFFENKKVCPMKLGLDFILNME